MWTLGNIVVLHKSIFLVVIIHAYTHIKNERRLVLYIKLIVFVSVCGISLEIMNEF